MSPRVSVEELIDNASEHVGRETTDDLLIQQYVDSVTSLILRAHSRGDGVAVYVNSDLGSADVGAWQLVSYGSPSAQIETTNAPTTLPDIGGAINWRYQLEAVCPATPTTGDQL